MPFHEAVGRDPHTNRHRSVRISANDERQALFAAASHDIAEPKLRPSTERELLMMDFKCFLNAEPAPGVPRSRAHKRNDTVLSYRHSLLLDHPVLTITCSVLLALVLSRILDLIVAML